jgi:hypothetical protein
MLIEMMEIHRGHHTHMDTHAHTLIPASIFPGSMRALPSMCVCVSSDRLTCTSMGSIGLSIAMYWCWEGGLFTSSQTRLSKTLICAVGCITSVLQL